eukprot:1774000-Pleurochrysis_carterae.AAC.1
MRCAASSSNLGLRQYTRQRLAAESRQLSTSGWRLKCCCTNIGWEWEREDVGGREGVVKGGKRGEGGRKGRSEAGRAGATKARGDAGEELRS